MAQRVNNKKYPGLSYQAKSNQRPRWRKRYKGREFYFVRHDDETIEQSYRRCLGEWHLKKAQIDAADRQETDPYAYDRERWHHCIGLLIELRDSVRNTPDGRQLPSDDDRRFYDSQIAIVEKLIRAEFPYRPEAYVSLSPVMPPRGGDKQWWELAPTAVPDEPGKTLRANADYFLERKLAEVRANKLSSGRYSRILTAVNRACEIVGPDFDVDRFDASTLLKVRDWYANRIASGELKQATAELELRAIRQMVRRLFEWERLNTLPRNIDSREMTLEVKETNHDDTGPKVFTDAEIATLFAAAPASTRLYMLLALNCGFRNQDIADIRQSEIDWTEGYVYRRRGKTAKKGTKKVRHKLWPETLAALKAARSDDAEWVLLNSNGLKLKRTEIDDRGKETRVDNVRLSWRRLIEKLKKKGTVIETPFAQFRATSASRLHSHPEYARYVKHFLNQKNGVTDDHYIVPDQDQFDEAVMWLGQQWLFSD